jgi:hypothetical protein
MAFTLSSAADCNKALSSASGPGSFCMQNNPPVHRGFQISDFSKLKPARRIVDERSRFLLNARVFQPALLCPMKQKYAVKEL